MVNKRQVNNFDKSFRNHRFVSGKVSACYGVGDIIKAREHEGGVKADPNSDRRKCILEVRERNFERLPVGDGHIFNFFCIDEVTFVLFVPFVPFPFVLS